MRTVILTGANGNVGSFFLEQFAKRGDRIIAIVHKNRHRIETILKKNSENIEVLEADLSDYELLEKKLSDVLSRSGWQPMVLIHTSTARSHDFKPLVESEPELWGEIIDINVKGTFNILKVVLPYLRENKFGRIMLFGSNVTRLGLPKGSAYAASKAAIANICRSVAAEEAKNNILINTISPGPIKIDDSNFSESYRKFRQEYYKEKIKLIPLKRYAKFEDLFGLSDFLISPENNYITGEEFFVTGGKL